MARDVSKVLSPTQMAQMAQQFRPHIDIEPDPDFGMEYPKMLYHPDFVESQRRFKNSEDMLDKKKAMEHMRKTVVVIYDIETEEEYLQDGWKTSPAEIIIDMGEADPRIPTGREARMGARMELVSREEELLRIRRRYAELTGQRLSEAESLQTPAPVAAVLNAKQPELNDGPATTRRPPPRPAAAKRRAPARV